MPLEDLPLINNPFFPKRVRELALIKRVDERKPQMYYVAARQINAERKEVLITSINPQMKDEKFWIYERNVIIIPVNDIEREGYQTKTVLP